MKKIFTLMIALMMVLCCAAFAEAEFDVEDVYEGVWVQFPDDGFEMYLPADWTEVEITDEILEGGIYYAIASPDGSMTFQLAWSELDEMVDVAALHADILTAYPEAEVLPLGNYEAVCFANADADILAFSMPDTETPGMYVFNFTPASNVEAVAYATVMVTSLRPIA